MDQSEFVAETHNLLKKIWNGYGAFAKRVPIADTDCKRCNGFLYIEQGGVGDTECPHCDGTGLEYEVAFDYQGFCEFIENDILFGDDSRIIELLEFSDNRKVADLPTPPQACT